MEIKADSMSEEQNYTSNCTVLNYWFILSFGEMHTKTFY